MYIIVIISISERSIDEKINTYIFNINYYSSDIFFIKLPVLRLDFLSFISVLIIFFGIAGIVDMMLDRGEHTSKLAKYNFKIAGVLIIFNIVAPFITSSPILHAKAYRNLIGEVKESKFTKM